MFGKRFIIDKIYFVRFYPKSDYIKNSRIRYNADLFSYELIYKLSGESISTFHGKKHHLTPGKTEYLPKRVPGGEYIVNIIEPGDCVDIYFDTTDELPKESLSFDTENNPNLRSLFLKLERYWNRGRTGDYYRCLSLFYEILAELTKTTDYLPASREALLEPAIAYIHEHYTDREFPYGTLHEKCGISYTYFKKLFDARFGRTPREYIIALRMNRACELLISRRYSVSQVAAEVGYENIYYFSNAFKQRYGCPPSKYHQVWEKKGDL